MSSDSVESAVEYLTRKEGFDCKEVLGKGTYGSVIKISSRQCGQKAAKIVENSIVNILEIQEWPRLDHHNVLRLVDTYLGLDGVVIFITDLMDTNLYRRLNSKDFRFNSTAPERCRLYARQVLAGMAYLHRLDLCHLDLRAENVLIAFDDRAVVADFSGMCRANDMKKFCPLPNSLRPPEMLGVRKRVEPMPVDLWAYGLLMTHLYLGKGFHECTVKHPKSGSLEACVQYMAYFQSQSYMEKFFSETYPNSEVSGVRLKELMAFVHLFLQLDPNRRTMAEEALGSGFLNASFYASHGPSVTGLATSHVTVLVPVQDTNKRKLDNSKEANVDNENADETTTQATKKKPWIKIGKLKIYKSFPFTFKSDRSKSEENPEKKTKKLFAKSKKSVNILT